MSVATVKARLVTIQQNITGVLTAYAQGPNSLSAANMPLFVNLTRKAEVDWKVFGSDMGLETRLYAMQLYVMPFGQGVPGEAEEACELFFPLVRDTFAARPSLEQLLGVQEATFLGDSGVIGLKYPLEGGSLYWGIEFRLQVKEVVERTYANSE
ncbi:MAG: hypothetical protein KDJ52_00185 [Anaerolineae bacterium]|nr:hypothetical protein [Anaerolineae bacterium]